MHRLQNRLKLSTKYVLMHNRILQKQERKKGKEEEYEVSGCIR